MCALWKLYLSGRWGWEADVGYILGPADDLRWATGRGRSWVSADQVFTFKFDQMPDIQTIQRIVADFEKRWKKIWRPSRFERDKSKR